MYTYIGCKWRWWAARRRGVGSAVAGPYFSGLLVAHRVLAVMLLVTLFAASRHDVICPVGPFVVWLHSACHRSESSMPWAPGA